MSYLSHDRERDKVPMVSHRKALFAQHLHIMRCMPEEAAALFHLDRYAPTRATIIKICSAIAFLASCLGQKRSCCQLLQIVCDVFGTWRFLKFISRQRLFGTIGHHEGPTHYHHSGRFRGISSRVTGVRRMSAHNIHVLYCMINRDASSDCTLEIQAWKHCEGCGTVCLHAKRLKYRLYKSCQHAPTPSRINLDLPEAAQLDRNRVCSF